MHVRFASFRGCASREPGVYRGPSAPDADALGLFADDGMRRLLDEWLREHRLEKLLNLWVRGIDFDWKALHVGRAPRPLALPAYPFARERYWVPTSFPWRIPCVGLWPSKKTRTNCS